MEQYNKDTETVFLEELYKKKKLEELFISPYKLTIEEQVKFKMILTSPDDI